MLPGCLSHNLHVHSSAIDEIITRYWRVNNQHLNVFHWGVSFSSAVWLLINSKQRTIPWAEGFRRERRTCVFYWSANKHTEEGGGDADDEEETIFRGWRSAVGWGDRWREQIFMNENICSDLFVNEWMSDEASSSSLASYSVNRWNNEVVMLHCGGGSVDDIRIISEWGSWVYANGSHNLGSSWWVGVKVILRRCLDNKSFHWRWRRVVNALSRIHFV